MILIWANFNAQSFIHLKLSMQCSELFFYVSTCLQQQCIEFALEHICMQNFEILRGFIPFHGILARAPLLFCPPRGFLKYIMVLIVLIFPKNLPPAVVHLLYLDQFGALVYSTTYKIVKTTNLITQLSIDGHGDIFQQ